MGPLASCWAVWGGTAPGRLRSKPRRAPAGAAAVQAPAGSGGRGCGPSPGEFRRSRLRSSRPAIISMVSLSLYFSYGSITLMRQSSRRPVARLADSYRYNVWTYGRTYGRVDTFSISSMEKFCRSYSIYFSMHMADYAPGTHLGILAPSPATIFCSTQVLF